MDIMVNLARCIRISSRVLELNVDIKKSTVYIYVIHARIVPPIMIRSSSPIMHLFTRCEKFMDKFSYICIVILK